MWTSQQPHKIREKTQKKPKSCFKGETKYWWLFDQTENCGKVEWVVSWRKSKSAMMSLKGLAFDNQRLDRKTKIGFHWNCTRS